MRLRALDQIARAVAVLALAALAAALAGCGGSGSADAILQQAFHPTEHISSGRLDLAMRLSATGLSTVTAPESLELAGPFQTRGSGQLPRFHLTATIASGGRNLAVGVIYTGSQFFLQLQGESFLAPASALQQLQQGYAQASRKAGAGHQATFASLGIDPGSWLVHPVLAGDRTLAGEPTIHITAGLDVPRFLADLNRISGDGSLLGLGSLGGSATSVLSAAQRAALGRSIKSARVDVYAGRADHVLRQLTLRAAIDTPPAERATLNGLRTGTLTLKLAFSAINQTQSISAPAGARPLSVLVSALQKLEGASGSGATSGASAGGSDGSSDQSGSGGQSAYVACARSAGGNLVKLQKCAPLLSAG